MAWQEVVASFEVPAGWEAAKAIDLSLDQLMEAINDYVSKHQLAPAGVYSGAMLQTQTSPEHGIRRMRVLYRPKQSVDK